MMEHMENSEFEDRGSSGPRVLSLFTGCGGLDLGFETIGAQTVECVDNDHESVKTLHHNRPDWKVFEGDICDYRPISSDVDIVIGGPPCQGFSTAGYGDPKDPRNYLWREYFRVVQEVRPRAIVLENVSALAHKRNNDHLTGIIDTLKRNGYDFAFDVLNAAEFGVPQVRRRLIVVGIRNGKASLPSPMTADNPMTVKDAIGDLENAPENAAFSHVIPRHARHVVKRWDALLPGETDPKYRRSRLIYDKPSVTIRAGGGYGPRGDHLAGFHPPIHPTQARQLTVREAARIQSFPDEWILRGSKTAQGRQIGNAVPVALARAIADHVANLLS